MERKFLRLNCINSLIENFKNDCPSLIITSSKKLHTSLSHYFKNIFTIEDYFSGNNTFDTDTDFTFVFERHDNISLHLDVLLNLKSVTLYHLENSPFPSYSNFITTIPKSGTHLLTSILESLGLIPFNMDKPGDKRHWNTLCSNNTHTTCNEFFVNHVKQAPLGGRHHPFLYNPTLFLYRNPFDVLLSEANYYPKPGKTLFYDWFRGMSFEDILISLIDHPILGTLSQRFIEYREWFRFPSVIPICYEQLISSNSGGNDKTFEDTIWSIMLKLKLPGSVSSVINYVTSTEHLSDTFHKAMIGNFQSSISKKVHDALCKIDLSFLHDYGYESLWNSDYQVFSKKKENATDFLPSNHTKLLIEPITLNENYNFNKPSLIETKKEHNIVYFKQEYFAFPFTIDIDYNDDNFFSSYKLKSRRIKDIYKLLNYE